MMNCQDCEENFEGHAALKLHISVVHEGKKPNECPSCGKVFSKCTDGRVLKANMIRHLNLCENVCSPGGNPVFFVCALCVKKFSKKS